MIIFFFLKQFNNIVVAHTFVVVVVPLSTVAGDISSESCMYVCFASLSSPGTRYYLYTYKSEWCCRRRPPGG